MTLLALEFAAIGLPGTHASAQTLPAPPKLMHWCAQHCSTWVWVGDRYVGQGTPHPEKSPQCGVTVERFTSESVILHRTDCTPYPGKAVLTGKLSPDGNSVVNGVIRWTYHPCCGLGSGTFTAAWGAALDSVPGSDQERAARAAAARAAQQSPGSALPVRTVDPTGQLKICTSRNIRAAMKAVEAQAIHDPNGAALQLLGSLFTGVNASSGPPKILDSKMGTDGGRYTSKDPGSFVCRGLFLRGDVRISETADADAASDIAADQIQKLTEKYPSFIEWFKVKPLEEGNYRLTLLPSSIQLSRQYWKDFTYPER